MSIFTTYKKAKEEFRENKQNTNMQTGQIYEDKYGERWILRWEQRYPSHWYLWNQGLGHGLWDNGKGLTLLNN